MWRHKERACNCYTPKSILSSPLTSLFYETHYKNIKILVNYNEITLLKNRSQMGLLLSDFCDFFCIVLLDPLMINYRNYRAST